METNVCCFIGHRKIIETPHLRRQLCSIIETLIKKENVETFLFGSKSRFNELCYEIVTNCKIVYPQIKRIYVRAEFPIITEDYKLYLLKKYEDTYYPKSLIRAGKAVYFERNCEMIKNSRFCVFYYNKNLALTTGKSGTEIALDFAKKQKKQVIKLC